MIDLVGQAKQDSKINRYPNHKNEGMQNEKN